MTNDNGDDDHEQQADNYPDDDEIDDNDNDRWPWMAMHGQLRPCMVMHGT